MTSAQSKLKKGVIRLSYDDEKSLYQAYMPFIEGCGIFYPTEEQYQMDQEVFVFLKLPGEHGKFAASGRIVWLNPPKKSARRVPGIGIQLMGREAGKIRESIEASIGNKILESGAPNMTI